MPIRFLREDPFFEPPRYTPEHPNPKWEEASRFWLEQTLDPSESFDVANVPPVQLQLVIRGKIYEMVPTPWQRNIGAANLVIWNSKVRLRGNRYDGLSFVSIRVHEDFDQRENREEIEFLLKIADELYSVTEERDKSESKR